MDSNLLPAKPFQETLHGSFCVPAVIKMVLDFYGIEKTEAYEDKIKKKIGEVWGD